MAYVALERFRYTNKVKQLLLNTQDTVYKRLKELNRQRDTILTIIADNLKEIENGIGPKLFFGRGPKLYGSVTRYGLDVPFIVIVLSSLFILLLYVTINYDSDNVRIFWLIFGFSCFVTIIPLAFIFGGNRQVKKYNKEINRLLGNFTQEYQVKINELQERVGN
jgi:hypothetical protein